MKFYDLGMYSSLSKGEDNFETMFKMAIELGWSGIGIADFEKVSPKLMKNSLKNYQDKIIMTRATLDPTSVNEMKKMIGDLRNQVDLIAIENSTDEKTIYLNAILDRRVDIITLSDIKHFELLDQSHFKMAKEKKIMIEIVVRNLIKKSGVQRSKFMRQMSKTCAQLIQSTAPFIISSGAQSKWELRAPKDIIALVDLVNIPKKHALYAISTNPEILLDKVRMIRDPNYIMAGVRVVSVKKEEDMNGK